MYKGDPVLPGGRGENTERINERSPGRLPDGAAGPADRVGDGMVLPVADSDSDGVNAHMAGDAAGEGVVPGVAARKCFLNGREPLIRVLLMLKRSGGADIQAGRINVLETGFDVILNRFADPRFAVLHSPDFREGVQLSALNRQDRLNVEHRVFRRSRVLTAM